MHSQPTLSPRISVPPGLSRRVALTPATQLALEVVSTADHSRLTLHLGCGPELLAHMSADLPPLIAPSIWRPMLRGWRLCLDFEGGRLSLWFRCAEDGRGIEVIEHSHGLDAEARWSLPGSQFHAHRGVNHVSGSPENASFQLGAHTQHGQLFDLIDWILVEHTGRLTGFASLRPGHWSTLGNVARVQGNAGEVTASFPFAGTIRRSWMLLTGLASQYCLAESIDGGPSHWWPVPARMIARHGFARPERMARYGFQSGLDSVNRRPERCLIAPDSALPRAFSLVAQHPALAANQPLWCGDWQLAKQATLQVLETSLRRWSQDGYLHPNCNPVHGRVIAPTFACFHLLDLLGHIAPAERRLATSQIAALTELVLRRDFSPWHLATLPEGQPMGHAAAIYRGMLNQNFSTDCYTLVGLAGCILPGHPRACAWRSHFRRHFNAQMERWVYPGGAWEESHTYHRHVIATLLPVVLAMREVEGEDLLQHPRFRETCRFHLDLLSPPDLDRGGRRFVPAVGDHGLPLGDDPVGYDFLFGWLSHLLPDESDQYRWAWEQTGRHLTHPSMGPIRFYSPLMIADPREVSASAPPPLSTIRDLPGLGALARAKRHTDQESLLVVRCGPAWGHYHPDQGSFWWWCRGRLVCADSDLGGGSLKFEHRGHNVLGYPGFAPLQHLDRVPYAVTRCTASGDTATITCDVPIWMWRSATGFSQRIAATQRPSLTRTFVVKADEHIRIVDQPRNSPGGLVQWQLWVAADSAVVADDGASVLFTLNGRGDRCLLALPATPLSTELKRVGATLGIVCVYAERELEHRLTFMPAGS